MAFSEEQIGHLKANLDGNAVKTRSQSGRSLSYVEGYWAIAEANRIFGFGEWDNEVVSLTPIVTTTQGEYNYKGRDKQGYLIAYTAVVRVRVRMEDGSVQTHEDVGYGEGIDYNNVGQAHESASKEAVTDALKRALKDWGNPFGLALYDKEQRNVDKAGSSQSGQRQQPQGQQRSAPQQQAPAGNNVRQLGDRSGGGNLSEKQIKRLYAIAGNAGWSHERLKASVKDKFGHDHLNEMTREQYDTVCTALEGVAAELAGVAQ